MAFTGFSGSELRSSGFVDGVLQSRLSQPYFSTFLIVINFCFYQEIIILFICVRPEFSQIAPRSYYNFYLIVGKSVWWDKILVFYIRGNLGVHLDESFLPSVHGIGEYEIGSVGLQLRICIEM